MLHSLGRFGATHQIESLPLTDGGLDAVRATLDKMRSIIRKYRTDVTTGRTARQILVACGLQDGRNRKQVITCLQNWVRDRIIYVYDPNGAEWLQTPPETLSIGTGDCDDKVLLLLSLLESVGIDTELLAVGGRGSGWQSDPGNLLDPSQPPPYSHVLGAARCGPLTGRLPPFLDGWLTLETIVPGAQPGYKPPGIRVLMPWRVD